MKIFFLSRDRDTRSHGVCKAFLHRRQRPNLVDPIRYPLHRCCHIRSLLRRCYHDPRLLLFLLFFLFLLLLSLAITLTAFPGAGYSTPGGGGRKWVQGRPVDRGGLCVKIYVVCSQRVSLSFLQLQGVCVDVGSSWVLICSSSY